MEILFFPKHFLVQVEAKSLTIVDIFFRFLRLLGLKRFKVLRSNSMKVMHYKKILPPKICANTVYVNLGCAKITL